MPKRDNSTQALKVSLRRNVLREIGDPVVMETHGGRGVIFDYVYRDVRDGVVIETDAERCEHLARQRPDWAIYQADCVLALLAGAGSHLAVNVVDIDPYGSPWPTIDAWFRSDRPRTGVLAIVVNDGLRMKLKIAGGYEIDVLRPYVDRLGSDAICEHYLEICHELLETAAAQAGYRLSRWAGYYCGNAKGMTHYTGIFSRSTDGV